jgi:hypothetical protein
VQPDSDRGATRGGAGAAGRLLALQCERLGDDVPVQPGLTLRSGDLG